MAELAYKIMVIMAKLAFYSVMTFSVLTLITIVSSALMIALNFGVINDVIGLIQMWLPFNLGVVILWILTASFAFLTYRLSVLAVSYINGFLNT